MNQRTSPSLYPPLPFNAFRILSLLSTCVVSGVLSYFSYRLKTDGFKLPWTFLIMLLACLIQLLSLLFTFVLQTCRSSRPSPLFNMLFNIPTFLCWTAGMVLIIYNMYGTLGHSCSISIWASSDGVMVCKIYKLFFSFVVFAWLSLIAQIILDIRAKRLQQTGAFGGDYDNLEDLQKKQSKRNSAMELNQFHSRDRSTGVESVGSTHSQDNGVPYGIIDQHHQRPRAARAQSSYREDSNLYDHGQQLRPGDFNHYAPNHQHNYTNYDSGNYGYSDRRY